MITDTVPSDWISTLTTGGCKITIPAGVWTLSEGWYLHGDTIYFHDNKFHNDVKPRTTYIHWNSWDVPKSILPVHQYKKSNIFDVIPE